MDTLQFDGGDQQNVDSHYLSAVQLSFVARQRVALIGPSGSGKSTLLRSLWRKYSAVSAYVAQDLGLVDNLSIFHNVYMGSLDKNSAWSHLRNLFLPAHHDVVRVAEILKQVELDKDQKIPVAELSGGERQRVAIARALFRGGQWLFADEPVSAVDDLQAQRLLKVLTESFSSVVFSLHDLGQMQANAQRIIVLDRGERVLDEYSQNVDWDLLKVHFTPSGEM